MDHDELFYYLTFPVPEDRTPNSPCVLLEKDDVLSIYNSDTRNITKYQKDDDVVKWFQQAANLFGWERCEFHGCQCLLYAKISLM